MVDRKPFDEMLLAVESRAPKKTFHSSCSYPRKANAKIVRGIMIQGSIRPRLIGLIVQFKELPMPIPEKEMPVSF